MNIVLAQRENLPPLENNQLSLLRKFLKSQKQVCIAYSGGVDSSLVATIAQEQLSTNAVAITGVSPSLAPSLLKEAREQAKWIGINHIECATNELEEPSYQTNPINRCFTCKTKLHQQLKEIAKATQNAKLLDGVNHDDLSDYRPGIQAAKLLGVISPLAELQINKVSIRTISRALGLPWWNKPSQPCLASRFPYGEPISKESLERVGKAEEWLREKGFNEIRVRSQGLSAKIELPPDKISQFILNINRESIIKYFSSIGFTSVSLDLEGLVSGKLNRAL